MVFVGRDPIVRHLPLGLRQGNLAGCWPALRGSTASGVSLGLGHGRSTGAMAL